MVMRRRSVLVVDDEENVAWTMGRLLKAEGFSVTSVTTTAAALENLKKHDFDVLMTDLRMEEADSGMTIIEVAKRRRYPPVLVIFTGYASEDVARRAMEMRIDYLACKPVDTEKMLNALERLLDRREILAKGQGAARGVA
jgi:two-component system, response regulator YesN